MENSRFMLKEKLSFYGIIKESLKIPTKNPIFFFILTFLTSLPLFCFLLFYQLTVSKWTAPTTQQTFIHKLTAPDLTRRLADALPCDLRPTCFSLLWRPLDFFDLINNIHDLVAAISWRFLLSGLLNIAIGQLLEILNAIAIVHSTSDIYSEQNNTVNLKEMLCKPFRKSGLKGPFITSIYALLLSSLTSIGLASMATQFLITGNIFRVIFGVAFIGLFTKYMEWSGIWNMGIVISILDEEKHGDVALGVSAYISRGSRKRGLMLMLMLFVWRIGVKIACLYLRLGQEEGRGLVIISVGEVGLVCFGHVLKWVVFTVYFYDCKKRFLDKKVDLEQGKALLHPAS